MEHQHCKEQNLQMFFFYQCFQISPMKEFFCLLCVGACSLTCTPATAITKCSCRDFSLLRVCLFIESSGEDFFPVCRRINVFFLYHPNSACMCNLKQWVCFSFTPQDPVKKDKSVVSLLCYKLPYQKVLS